MARKAKYPKARFVVDWEISVPDEQPEQPIFALEMFNFNKSSLERVLIYASEAKRLGQDLVAGKPKKRRNVRRIIIPSKSKQRRAP